MNKFSGQLNYIKAVVKKCWFSGGIGIIELEDKVFPIYLDWRCLQNILEDFPDLVGREIDFIHGTIRVF